MDRFMRATENPNMPIGNRIPHENNIVRCIMSHIPIKIVKQPTKDKVFINEIKEDISKSKFIYA